MKKTVLIASGIVSGSIVVGCSILAASISMSAPRSNDFSSASTQRTENIQQESESSGLSEAEKRSLTYGYTEEMVARDAYNYLFSVYGNEVFREIASSEQHHMDVLKPLLVKYSIPLPTKYGEIQETFNIMKAAAEKGEKDALEVGLKIEMFDIKNISEFIRKTNREDFKTAFLNIGIGSYYHISEFSKALSREWFTTNVDVSPYLSADEINGKISFRNKLADSLR